jgi:hypothetical protein
VADETVTILQQPSSPYPNRASEAALEGSTVQPNGQGIAEGRSPIPDCSDGHSIGVLDDADDLFVPPVLDNEDFAARVPADLAEDELQSLFLLSNYSDA